MVVDNRCLDGEGEPTQALGEGIGDPEHPGRLRVSFLPAGLRWIPFTRADYWVLRIDPEYRVALVGAPDRDYLWLLAREPRLDADVEREYLDAAREQGFELADWIRTPQSGGRVTDERLAANGQARHPCTPRGRGARAWPGGRARRTVGVPPTRGGGMNDASHDGRDASDDDIDEPVMDGATDRDEGDDDGEPIDPRKGMSDPALIRDVESGKTTNPYG